MDEYGTFYNTVQTKQNITFDKGAGLAPMESQYIKEPIGSYNNPVEVTDENGIYYHSEAPRARPQISFGSNYHISRNRLIGCCNIKSSHTTLERNLIAALSAFLVVMVISYITFFCYLSREGGWGARSPCRTSLCVETAGDILHSMNRDIDPCENFFEFACGGWKTSNPTPDNRDRWDTFGVAYERMHFHIKESFESKPSPDEPMSVKQLRTGFQACLNQTAWDHLGAKPLINLLEDFGGLPMISPTWKVESFDFVKSLARLIRDYDEKFIIGIYVVPDMKDSSRFTLQMDEGILPVSRYLLYEKNDIKRKKWINTMTTVATILLDASLEIFRSKNTYVDQRHKHRGTHHPVPFFSIPANHSYVVTQRSGDISMETNGETYTKIFSNDTHLFKYAKKHRNSEKYSSGRSSKKYSHRGNQGHHSSHNKNGQHSSYHRNKPHSGEESSHKKIKRHIDLLPSLMREDNNDLDTYLPFLKIPAYHPYGIRQLRSDRNINTIGEAYEKISSNEDTSTFQYFTRKKRSIGDPDLHRAASETYLNHQISGEVLSLTGGHQQRKHHHTKKVHHPIRKLSYSEMEDAFRKQEIILKNDISDLWIFYGKLAEIMEPESSSENEETYNPMTVEELNEFNSRINITWKQFLTDVTEGTGINIDYDTLINVAHPSYFDKLVPLIMRTHPRVLANAILFQLILNMGTEVTPYREPAQEFLGRHERRAWFDCAQKMSSLMGLATARLFYDGRSTDHAEDIKKVTDLVKDLKIALLSGIKGKSWMDKDTKGVALQKVKSLEPIVGFPTKYLNNTILDDVYKQLPELSGTDHFGNIQKLLKFSNHHLMSKYYENPSREDFLSSPLDVNAFYSIQRNNIQIPMGILMSPFYRRHASKAFHYGSTGAILAHELSHGFDVKGRKWDAEGNLYQWWGRSALRTYMKKALCYAKQYEPFPLTFKILGRDGEPIKLNSKRTLAENIADSEGLHLAWKAFMTNKAVCQTRIIGMDDYTPEQLFFIGYGQMWCSHYSPSGMKRSLRMDVHSPHPARVNGAARNHPEFANVFHCPKNSTMFNDEFCNIW